MKINLKQFTGQNPPPGPIILLAARAPHPEVLELLSERKDLVVREAYTTRGVLQQLPGVHLVILDEVIQLPDTPLDLLRHTLEVNNIPFVSQDAFLKGAEEWLGQANLPHARNISYLSPRQVHLLGWAGGVGKTTLALALCKRFVEQSGLPAALLELSPGASALQVRIPELLPDFFAIATGRSAPALWEGASLYPMDGAGFEVLWEEDPGKVRQVIEDVRAKHSLMVVDGYPGHPLFSELGACPSNLVNLVIASPRPDALIRARAMISRLPEPAHLVLNMTRNIADRTEPGVGAYLPLNESWAQAYDRRLADPVLELIYPGWKAGNDRMPYRKEATKHTWSW